MEVTDDKRLPREQRKKIEAETAHKKTTRAKILKLADKTSNMRALLSSPAPDWSVKRKMNHIEWARKTLEGLRGANASLEKAIR
jgi:GTP diphosphokinase / guanosine-3',5'-bis(diphosphate) 3'-diphosphatase